MTKKEIERKLDDLYEKLNETYKQLDDLLIEYIKIEETQENN